MGKSALRYTSVLFITEKTLICSYPAAMNSI